MLNNKLINFVPFQDVHVQHVLSINASEILSKSECNIKSIEFH